MLIDDFSRTDLVSALGTEWRGVSDRVMGGVSQESVSRSVEGDRPSLHLQGDVRLENNGGFIQAALDLSSGGPNTGCVGLSRYSTDGTWQRRKLFASPSHTRQYATVAILQG